MSSTIKTNLEVGGTSAFKDAFRQAAAAVKKWREDVGLAVSGVKDSLSGVKGGLVGVAAAGLALRKALSASGEFEKLTTQFQVLLGSADAAGKRMEELAKFGAATPFELTEVARASITLQTLTRGALATGKGLEMVGDLAAGSGEEFGNMATHVGRLYDGLMSGRPVGEAMARLQELGIISGDVRARIEALQAQGRKGDEVWQIAAGSFSRFSGMMASQSGTLFGVLSNLKDQYDALAREMGKPIADALKPVLVDLIENAEAYKEKARELGEAVVAAGQFLADHKTAIFNTAMAWAALRGAIATKEIVTATAALVQAILSIAKGRAAAATATAAATAVETAAINANTAAVLANNAAKGAGGNQHGFKGVLGEAGGGRHAKTLAQNTKSVIASAMETAKKWSVAFAKGVATGARVAGMAFLRGLGAVVTAATATVAAIGAAVAAGIWMWADSKEKSANAALRLNEQMNGILKTQHAAVNAAKTEADTAAARASIEKQIAALREQAAKTGSEEQRAMLLGVVASLEQLSAQADKVRLRNLEKQALQEAADRAAVLADQERAAAESARESAKAAKERAEHLAAARKELEAQVDEMQSTMRWKLFDRMDAARQVEILTSVLREKLSSAAAVINSGNRLSGDPKEVDFRSSKDISREYTEARKSGNLERAKRLLVLLEETLEIEDKIAAAKEKAADQDQTRADFERELNALRAEAAGDTDGAKAIRLENDIRKEALAIARELGIAEEKALAIAREKAALAKQAAVAAEEKAKKEATSKTAGQLASEIKILRLRAAGRKEAADALEGEIAMRAEAQRLADGTTISEKNMLEILRYKATLQARINETSKASGAPGGRIQASHRMSISGAIEGANGLHGARGLGTYERDRRARENRPDPAAKLRDSAAKYYERSLSLAEETLTIWKKLGIA